MMRGLNKNRANGSRPRWALVGVLSLVAVFLLLNLANSVSEARAQSGPGGSASGGSVFAIAGKISDQTYGLYLVDYENKTLCVYQYVPKDRNFRLMAARTYAFDVRLDAYNTSPEPREIKKLVEQHRRLETTDK